MSENEQGAQSVGNGSVGHLVDDYKRLELHDTIAKCLDCTTRAGAESQSRFRNGTPQVMQTSDTYDLVFCLIHATRVKRLLPGRASSFVIPLRLRSEVSFLH